MFLPILNPLQGARCRAWDSQPRCLGLVSVFWTFFPAAPTADEPHFHACSIISLESFGNFPSVTFSSHLALMFTDLVVNSQPKSRRDLALGDLCVCVSILKTLWVGYYTILSQPTFFLTQIPQETILEWTWTRIFIACWFSSKICCLFSYNSWRSLFLTI